MSYLFRELDGMALSGNLNSTRNRSSKQQIFGQRREPHRITIARGNKVKSFTLRPWLSSVLTLFVFIFSVSYLSATAYLFFRDDILTSSTQNQTRLRYNYENRIANLRSKIDRINSRQMIDQHVFENKIEVLLERQEKLVSRDDHLREILKRARIHGLIKTSPSSADLPPTTNPNVPSPDKQASLSLNSIGLRGSSSVVPTPRLFANVSQHHNMASLPASTQQKEAHIELPDVALAAVELTLDALAKQQENTLDKIQGKVQKKVQKIHRMIAQIGFSAQSLAKPAQLVKSVGGPFAPPRINDKFPKKANDMIDLFDYLDRLRNGIFALPIRRPLPPEAKITSRFGNRLDPFLRRPAFHGGIDYRAKYGTLVKVSGHGKVIKAGWAGGYGRIVEISHGNGITTRYAHLSKILVKKGDRIKSGTNIGRVGSSGRSTGPHLHYETRQNDSPIDPMQFLRTGQKLAQLF